MNAPNDAARQLLRALAAGDGLKVHRDVDGNKQYTLHPLAGGASQVIEPKLVTRLERQRFLKSNMKFPAAVLLLTEQGAAASAISTAALPIGPKQFR